MVSATAAGVPALLASAIFLVPLKPPKVKAFETTVLSKTNDPGPPVKVLPARAEVFRRFSVPALTHVVPLKVFAPERLRVPAPSFTKEPTPETAPLIVIVRAVVPSVASRVLKVVPAARSVRLIVVLPVQLALAPTVAAPKLIDLLDASLVIPREPRFKRPPVSVK